jgi:hypothetical protein
MDVNVVKATIRYSKEVQGAWKSVELGAEASLSPEETENWPLAMEGLYSSLTVELRNLWGQNPVTQETALEGPETVIQRSPAAGPSPRPRAHWCTLHEVPFKRFEKDGQVWHSHKTTEGDWCKEMNR